MDYACKIESRAASSDLPSKSDDFLQYLSIKTKVYDVIAITDAFVDRSHPWILRYFLAEIQIWF